MIINCCHLQNCWVFIVPYLICAILDNTLLLKNTVFKTRDLPALGQIYNFITDQNHKFVIDTLLLQYRLKFLGYFRIR